MFIVTDLIVKEDIDAGIMPPEKEITEEMSEAERKLIERQREIAMKRVRDGDCVYSILKYVLKEH